MKLIKVEVKKHGLDYRKFYTKLQLDSKIVASKVAKSLSEITGMKWKCIGKSGQNNFKFETMIITNKKKRRKMLGKIIEIEI